MTRNPLILVTLALGLVLGGCSNRSIGNKIDDQFLEPNVANAISRSHPDLTGPTSHIVVTAYNGVILLAGQTPRADLKEKAAQVANGVQGVKKLHNELQVLQPTSALARSNDALITSKIKTLMLADSKVPSAKVKVVTENGWFAARPSGTESIYKIYMESFKGEAHLDLIQQEAQQIVSAALAKAGV